MADTGTLPTADVAVGAEMLARAADAVFVLDITSGKARHRWYDPEHSNLDLPAQAEDRVLVTAIHPDDLPEVLSAYSTTVHTGDERSAFARINPDLPVPERSSLLLNFRDVRDAIPDGILIQVWLIHADSIVSPNREGATSLSSLAAAAPVGLQVMSGTGIVSFENERFTSLAAGDRASVEAAIVAAIEAHRECAEDLWIDGRSLRLRVVPTLDASENLIHAVASLEDATRIHQAEAGRVAAEEQFDAVFSSSPLATVLATVDGRLVRANESFAIVTGHDVDHLIGMEMSHITHPDDLDADASLLEEVLTGVRRNYQVEKRLRHASGHDVWVEMTVAPVGSRDGTTRHVVIHADDVTSRRSMIDLEGGPEDLTYWATHDHLTTLPNRRYLDHHLGVTLRRSRRRADRPVVMFIDLDDFKPVNDRLGHHVGDEVLRTTARRLRNACRDDALVARYGGDEFVVVARRLRTVADVPVLVQRIMSATRAPIATGQDEEPMVRVSACVGIAIARESDDPESLLARADKAAYQAKRGGKNLACFDPQLDLV